MTNSTTAAITGSVATILDGGRSVIVELTTAAADITAVVVITHASGRRAALRWRRGDRIAAWGWTAPLTETPTAIVVHAHTVQRSRPGHPLNITDPLRRTPPGRRLPIERQRLQARLDRDRALHEQRRRRDRP